MEPYRRVLLLTREAALQNLVEQVCLINGYRAITVVTVEDAHALTAQGGRAAFALAVIDTAALLASDHQQPYRVHQRWQEWTATYPDIPLVFVGTMSPNGDLMAHSADFEIFLEKPFGPRAFAGIMQMFLTRQQLSG